MGSKKIFSSLDAKQKKSLFVLIFLVVCTQAFIFYYKNFDLNDNWLDDAEWEKMEAQVKSTEALIPKKEIRMFNPNFISDEKGYLIGMKVEELDRLFAFRKKGMYVKNANEFQQLTKVSDEWMAKWQTYFRFPVFENNRKYPKKDGLPYFKKEQTKIVKLDLNLATQEELVEVPGIGDFYSEKIISMREELGGFVDLSQLGEIWGVSETQISKWKTHLYLKNVVITKKIPVNSASLKELSSFFYFKKGLARKLLIYRSMNGDLKDKNDLMKIKDFPIEKIDIIALYLDF